MTSRAVMMTTGNIQNTPRDTKVNIAPSTSTLSASGSRNAPERVMPWRRAKKPSKPSLAHNTNHAVSATHEPPGATGITVKSSGDTTKRPTVTALAHVTSALGSTDNVGPLRYEVGAVRIHDA